MSEPEPLKGKRLSPIEDEITLEYDPIYGDFIAYKDLVAAIKGQIIEIYKLAKKLSRDFQYCALQCTKKRKKCTSQGTIY